MSQGLLSRQCRFDIPIKLCHTMTSIIVMLNIGGDDNNDNVRCVGRSADSHTRSRPDNGPINHDT